MIAKIFETFCVAVQIGKRKMSKGMTQVLLNIDGFVVIASKRIASIGIFQKKTVTYVMGLSDKLIRYTLSLD